MADWTDGAQYAPLERPDAFAMPSAAPLAGTTRTPGLAEGRPDSAPARYAEPEGTVALEVLEPARGPQRDPQEPFADGSTSSGWGAVHASWQPTMPLGDPAVAEPAASFPPPAGPPTVPAAAGAAGVDTPLPPGAFPPPTGAPVAFPPPTEAVPGQSGSSAWPRDPYAALPAPPTSQPAPQQSAQFPPPAPQQPTPPRSAQFPPPAHQSPEPWQQAAPPQVPGQQFPAPRMGQPPAPASSRVVELVRGLGPVMLGALVLGLLWPAVSVVALVIASWLTTRTRLGLRVIRPAFNGAFLVLLVGWLSSLAGTPVVDYGVLARIICLVLLVTSLAAGWADLSRRR